MGNSLIKSAQRNGCNDNCGDKNRNQTQWNGENSNQTPVAGTSDESQNLLSSPIFKLNGHCFDELFEYLALKDLHSLGQTCKSMQRMTGEFFTRNYLGAKFNCLCDGIYLIDCDTRKKVPIDKCIRIPGFMQFITWLAIENNIVAGEKKYDGFHRTDIYYYDMGKFKYIKLHAHELKSVRKLTLSNMNINKKTVGYIREILPNIEVLELISCTVLQDLYDVLLKYCKNVRRIQLSRVNFKMKYKWLRRHYEKLEHLRLVVKHPIKIDRRDKIFIFFKCDPNLRIRGALRIRRWLKRRYVEIERPVRRLVKRLGWFEEDELEVKKNKMNRIAELCEFFERNPNLRSFSCDESTLLFYKDALLNSNTNLDTFELICNCFEDKPLHDLLYQLHTNGFYKRLHIRTRITNHCVQLSTVQFLEELSVGRYDTSISPFSSHLIGYAESGESAMYGWDDEFWEEDDILRIGKTKNEVLAEILINVERLYLNRDFSLDIPLFVQRLKNLKKFKLIRFESAEILKLDVLNRSRSQLAGAQKVTIYVPEDVFLATKWATKNGTTNFSLIEIKRTHSIEWNPRETDYMTTHVLPPGMF